MSIPTAVSQLIEVEASRNEGVLSPDKTLAIAMSRVGAHPDTEEEEEGQRIVCGTLTELSKQDPSKFGKPLHSLVIVGKRLHHLEVEYAERYAVDKESWREVAKDVYGCSLE